MYYILIFLWIVVFFVRRTLRKKRRLINKKKKKQAELNKKKALENENFVDTYSIPMQADALNRMARRNAYHSRHTSSLNYKIVPPQEYDDYYTKY